MFENSGTLFVHWCICVSGTQVTLIKYLEGIIVLYRHMLGDSNYIILYVRIYNIGMYM